MSISEYERIWNRGQNFLAFWDSLYAQYCCRYSKGAVKTMPEIQLSRVEMMLYELAVNTRILATAVVSNERNPEVRAIYQQQLAAVAPYRVQFAPPAPTPQAAVPVPQGETLGTIGPEGGGTDG